MTTINFVETGNEHVENAIVHELDDMGINAGSLRTKTGTIRYLHSKGWTVRGIAEHFGMSKEWVRRIVCNVNYKYVDPEINVESAIADAIS